MHTRGHDHHTHRHGGHDSPCSRTQTNHRPHPLIQHAPYSRHEAPAARAAAHRARERRPFCPGGEHLRILAAGAGQRQHHVVAGLLGRRRQPAQHQPRQRMPPPHRRRQPRARQRRKHRPAARAQVRGSAPPRPARPSSGSTSVGAAIRHRRHAHPRRAPDPRQPREAQPLCDGPRLWPVRSLGAPSASSVRERIRITSEREDATAHRLPTGSTEWPRPALARVEQARHSRRRRPPQQAPSALDLRGGPPWPARAGPP